MNPFLAAEPCCLSLPDNGDYTGDGFVDIDDLAELSELWLTCCNQQQFGTLANNWKREIHRFYETESAGQQMSFSPFTVQNDSSVSGGQYTVVPNGVGNNFSAPANTGIIEFDFETEEPVAVWLRVYTPTPEDDSFWMQVDDNGWTVWNGIGASGGWMWKKWADSICGPVPAMVFRYANGGTADRRCSVTLNGETIGQLDFSPTGSWTSWQTAVIHAEMLEGAVNTIRLTANTSSGGPNLDSLTVSGTAGNDVYQAENGTYSSCSVSTGNRIYRKRLC